MSAVEHWTRTARATFAREWLSYRVNRFVYLHLGLMAATGLLALLAPPEAGAAGFAWWVMNGVLYVGTLSALLFGLSSAQAETEEFPMLFTHPVHPAAWVCGKALGLGVVIIPAAALLVAPAAILSGVELATWHAAGSAAGVTVLFAWFGLSLGLWVHDAVRGLIAALVTWCVLLFGLDLILISIGGSPWIHRNPGWWVGAMMVSPLDAYRVMHLFVTERAAFTGGDLDALAKWWLDHPVSWFFLCFGAWSGSTLAAAVIGARRRATSG